MSDTSASFQGDETQVSGTEGSEAVTQVDFQPEPQGATGINPAWEPLKQKLGPSFEVVKDDLAKMDRAAQERITSLNGNYAPFKALLDQGHSLQNIQAALDLVKRIDTDPLAFNSQYQGYLRQRGLLQEEIAQQQAANQEIEPGDGEQGFDISQDPRFQQLAQQNQQVMEFLQTQQYEAQVAQADQALTGEIDKLKQDHPELSDEDVKETLRRAASIASTTKKVPSLEEAAQGVIAYRNNILSQPRAADSAPRLLPTSGGVPSGDGQRKSLGQLSNQETVDLMAGLIRGTKGS